MSCFARPSLERLSVQLLVISHRTLYVFCVSAILCLAQYAFAQTGTATLSGTIADTSGALMPDVSLKITNQDTGVSVDAETNHAGIYSKPGLTPGRYRVLVEKEGFKQVDLRDLTLNVQDVVSRNFTLEIGGTSETVQVDGSGVSVNTTDATVSTVVDRQFVENIPLNGRSFQSLISLTPGVVAVPGATAGATGEFSVNGQRTEGNYYTVDGVSANTGSSLATALAANGSSGSTPSQTSLGTTQSLVSIDALQEFRIQTSTYSAEYGRTPGGQISFVTRSGTNDFHGTAFEYFRNGALDANNWFNDHAGLAKTSERQNDFGGVFNGPVRIPHLYDGRDKTFFFFSYEGLRLSVPQPAVTVLVPDMAFRKTVATPLQPYINAFPLPNGASNGDGSANFTTAYSTPGVVDATSIRIDHTFNSRITMFARYNDSPSQTTSRGSTTTDLNNPDITSSLVRSITVGVTAMLTHRLTNDFRFNSTWNTSRSQLILDNLGGGTPFSLGDVRDVNGQPTPEIDATTFYGPFPGWFFQLSSFHNQQRQINVVDSIDYSLGAHSFKAGVDYRREITPLTLFALDDFGLFGTTQSLQQNSGTAIVLSESPIPTAPIYTNLSFFVQDNWKATRRLSLSLGLRWEINPPPGDAYGNIPYTVNQITNLSTTALAPKGTPLWNTTYGNVAPRVSAAYQAHQASGKETVIRGGFGVFYDMGNTYASQGYGGIGNSISNAIADVPWPLTSSQLTLPAPNVSAPYDDNVFGFDPNLKLPYTLQWSAAIEQALGRSQTVSATYVGAAGRRLLWSRQILPASLGNPNFTPTGELILTTNGSVSDYNALQLQFKRRLSKSLQLLASYTWSHAIDDTSTNFLSPQLLRGNSNFDVRNNFQLAATYNIPGKYDNALASTILRNWALDARITGQSALPVDVVAGTIVDSSGNQRQLRADSVPGQPLYIEDPTAPGGRKVNFNAFTIPTATEQAAGSYGNAPRNVLRGFKIWQTNTALARMFPLGDRVNLQFRAEAFNVFNHPIFGAIQNDLTQGATLFGLATGTVNNQLGGLSSLYQTGGPRSLQLSLKLQF